MLTLEATGAEELALREVPRMAGVSNGYARLIVHRLARKGWLQRVGPGRYLVNPARYGPDVVPDSDPLRIGSHLVTPYYFGYATAAELHGLLPQASRVYYVVSTTRYRHSVVHPATFQVVRTTPPHFFGIETMRRRGLRLRVSDPEKTLLDCLRRPDLAGGIPGVLRMLESGAGRLRWARLERYLRRDGDRPTARRLGFLAERARQRLAPPPAWLARLRAGPGEAVVPLGSVRRFGPVGTLDRRWGVLVNLPEPLLTSEVDLR